jgi:peptidoglycan-associated lipoprotein
MTIRNSTYVLSTGFVLVVALLSIAGCSQTALDGADATMGQQGAGSQKFLTSMQSSSTQSSSLEAHQDGTLSNGGPLRDIHFEFDRYDLSQDAKEILKLHATWLRSNPQGTLEIEGHGDDRGTNEYNVALGAKRAENVKRYLIDLGIIANRLATISYGEELPLCKEHNESCWGKNRRAHFVVKGAPTT